MRSATDPPAAGSGPRLLVLSSLFPSAAQPTAGVFIRERMFRVGRSLPIVVLAPQAWFPLQGLIRRFRPHFRPSAPRFERMQGFEVHRPRFLSIPGVLKWTDGFFMALGSFVTARRLLRTHGLNVLDVHFGYPDGAAGRLLARWLQLPMVLTLRGKEERQLRTAVAAPLRAAVLAADHVITVSAALRDVALSIGRAPGATQVIGNGIDLAKFSPLPQLDARAELGIAADAQVLVSVGTLVERKGFHRVIECLPALRARFPRLLFLVVGGAGPEGDMSRALLAQVQALGVADCVRFLGPLPPDRLRGPLSAADVFVLASSYEGWANVLLEAMACGLPVVATDVGGNAQVVARSDLGRIVPFGDAPALGTALAAALEAPWDRTAIRAYAEANAWDARMPLLLQAFAAVLQARRGPPTAATTATLDAGSSHAR